MGQLVVFWLGMLVGAAVVVVLVCALAMAGDADGAGR